MYYQIGNTLTETKDTKQKPYLAVFTSTEWEKVRDGYPFHIETDEFYDLNSTNADVHLHSLSGSFSIPDRNDLNSDDKCFRFALNEYCVVFIDDTGYVNDVLSYIIQTKKWNSPGIGRLVYDFLDYIVKDDVSLMEKYELELEKMEDCVNEDAGQDAGRLNEIRSEIRRFHIHYEQLLDLAQELEENENGYFTDENLRHFQSYINRVDRLLNTANSLREYVLQIEDMYRDHIAVKQNRITTLLTVVTTVFAPLTLITGWYGMNFKYMPELNYYYSYPIVMAVCLIIAVVMLWYFNRKKWL